MMHKNQRGSALIVIVTIVAAVLLLILVGNIGVYTKEATNTLPAAKAAYLDKAEKAITSWYRKNASRIDNPTNGLCTTFTSDQLFKEIMLAPDFGARIRITPCLDVQKPTLVYRNLAVWIPAPAITDTALFSPNGTFSPGNSEVLYRVVSGSGIEIKLIAETRAQLQEIARSLELRFKAKIEIDPAHDLNVNHFRAISCDPGYITMDEEIPCSSIIGASNTPPSASAVLDDNAFKTLKLAKLISVSQSMNRDSWGQYIVLNNILDDPGNPCVPENNITANSRPPYRMMLSTVTPWGESITICAVQPVN